MRNSARPPAAAVELGSTRGDRKRTRGQEDQGDIGEARNRLLETRLATEAEFRRKVASIQAEREALREHFLRGFADTKRAYVPAAAPEPLHDEVSADWFVESPFVPVVDGEVSPIADIPLDVLVAEARGGVHHHQLRSIVRQKDLLVANAMDGPPYMNHALRDISDKLKLLNNDDPLGNVMFYRYPHNRKVFELASRNIIPKSGAMVMNLFMATLGHILRAPVSWQQAAEIWDVVVALCAILKGKSNTDPDVWRALDGCNVRRLLGGHMGAPLWGLLRDHPALLDLKLMRESVARIDVRLMQEMGVWLHELRRIEGIRGVAPKFCLLRSEAHPVLAWNLMLRQMRYFAYRMAVYRRETSDAAAAGIDVLRGSEMSAVRRMPMVLAARRNVADFLSQRRKQQSKPRKKPAQKRQAKRPQKGKTAKK